MWRKDKMGIFTKQEEAAAPVVEAPTMRLTLYVIKTYFNVVVEGKNKRFTKSFAQFGRNKKDALRRFYDYGNWNKEFVVKEIARAEYKGK